MFQKGRLTGTSAMLLLCVAAADTVHAEELLAGDQLENAAIRDELARIEKENPDRAAEARMTIEALDSPSTQQGRQLRNRRERGARRIVNGIHTIRHAAVAAVLRGNKPATATAWCTGTLVGCDKVLTAAHCISEDPRADGYLVYFPLLGFFEIKTITWLKDEYEFPHADLAMLTLSRSIEGIAPVSVNLVATPIKGSVGTIVGFGRTGGNRLDYGIKREGTVKFGACKPDFADKKLLCWDFDADINVTPQDANTCNADSGGGVFMLDKEGQRSVQRVVGVVSGGLDRDCVKGDHSYNTDVFQWREWLTQAGEGRLSAEACGAQTIDTLKDIRSRLVMLGPERQQADFFVDMPASSASLRVALNGEDDGNGKNDFDLFVSDRDSGQACAQDGAGQFAFCEVSRPTSGRWSISLRRKKGAGAAQLTVTILPEYRKE